MILYNRIRRQREQYVGQCVGQDTKRHRKMDEKWHSGKCLVAFGAALCILAAGISCISAETAASKKQKDKWERLLDKYKDADSTEQLIFVKYKGGSQAELVMFQKEASKAGNRWTEVLSCPAYVGKNGIGKTQEGDQRTPTGTFRILSAFGVKENPGTRLPYTVLNPYLYWSAERETYNQMVDIRETGVENGEHLMDYQPQYHYAMVIGYNQRGVYGKGSAIFLHVKGNTSYTAGCVSVSEKDMKKILKNATKRTKICIYSAS